MEFADDVNMTVLFQPIFKMEHNTGTVEQKLLKLKGLRS